MFGMGKKKATKKTVKKAPAKKAVVKKAPAKRKKTVACPDCQPRHSVRTGDIDPGADNRSSGLTDNDTICPSCNGSGQVKE